jgi:hypothetical protein
MVLIIIGIIGIVLSGILTKQSLNKHEIPTELLDQTAGTGLVPKWISLVNITSWVVLGVGVLSLIF